MNTLHVDGHDIQVTHPDKLLFPADDIAKADLIRYYQEAGPRMLPMLAGRPLTLQRFPDGIDRPGFLQKAASPYFPKWMTFVTVKKTGGTLRQVIGDNVATLVYLANQACITPHVWLSRADRPGFPDQMVFDLDPSIEDLAAVLHGAQMLRELLGKLEFPAFVKSTGSRGLHVAVPLHGSEDFETVRAVARQIAEAVVAAAPDRYTLEQHKEKRQNRVFIDINRNGYAQTVVANYAVRARPVAPVAMPLDWSALKKKAFRIDGVTIRNIAEHLAEVDPWAGFWRHAVSLANVRGKLEKLRAA